MLCFGQTTLQTGKLFSLLRSSSTARVTKLFEIKSHLMATESCQGLPACRTLLKCVRACIRTQKMLIISNLSSRTRGSRIDHSSRKKNSETTASCMYNEHVFYITDIVWMCILKNSGNIFHLFDTPHLRVFFNWVPLKKNGTVLVTPDRQDTTDVGTLFDWQVTMGFKTWKRGRSRSKERYYSSEREILLEKKCL